MPDGENEPNASLKLIQSIGDVPAEQWDACAGPDNPFLSHAFLSALEDSGSVEVRTGWMPQHLVLENSAGELIAACPLYLKGHSHGEYVFDWGWADAYERAGGKYYPKLLSAVPFTPVPGPRFLIRPGQNSANLTDLMISGLQEATRRLKVSSAHLNFLQPEQAEPLYEAGFLKRLGLQYHWHNQVYEDFDEFLAALSSRKRKAIKKERRQVEQSPVKLSRLTGEDIKPDHWDAFFRFYIDTSDRKWGSAYLTREFFDLLGERMSDRVMLVMAEVEGVPVGGALNLIGSDALYGRNWGCIADFKFLHFEACYYQAIDFAIERSLGTVEAGAQGQHKIQRGYLPTLTYSAHYLPDPGFESAVEDFLQRERRQIAWEMDALNRESPFKKID